MALVLEGRQAVKSLRVKSVCRLLQMDFIYA